MDILSKNIKRLRQKAGWTQSMMAQKVGLSIPAMSKIESGLTDMSLSRLTVFARIFEVPVASLLFRPGENPDSVSSRMVNELSSKIEESETEIISLQTKIINLYEELRNQNL